MSKVSGFVIIACTGFWAIPAFGQLAPCYQLAQPGNIELVAFSYSLDPEPAGAEGEALVEQDAPSTSPSDLQGPETPVNEPPARVEISPEAAEPLTPGFTCDPCGDYRWSENACAAFGVAECGTGRYRGRGRNAYSYGGWVSAGIYANAWGAKNNGPLTLREYGNGFTVDQTWFYFEKAIDNGGYGLDWGGRVDFLWGADGPDTQCFGDEGWDGSWYTSKDDNYGSALPQLYGELAYNNTSIKIGHFYTIIGYEVIPAPDNFFYSHSDILAFEPYTHMGALATHKWNDRLTFHGGWVNGWDNGWLNPSGASAFLGGASLKLCENATLTYATSFGSLWDTKNTLGGSTNIDLSNTGYMHSIVFQTKLTRRLTYVFQSDFLTRRFDVAYESEQASIAYKVPNRVYGINQYLFYQLNEKWAAGVRAEWLRNEEAIDYGQAGRISQSYNASELTLGLNYKPTENIIIRPEIRWDWYEGAPVSVFPFNDNANSYQFSGGFDMIVTF
jgi:hypothetical protein